MTTEITTYLKYANLQVAAEAFFGLKNAASGTTGPVDLTVAFLKAGNDHPSKFTEIGAQAFIGEGWTVVEHKSNTSTGFSGTLFKNTQTGEQVISFRSTEFVEDAVRDNQATNVMEIYQNGWAFGQISDMRAWVDSLYANGDISTSEPVAVTGYTRRAQIAIKFIASRARPAGAAGPKHSKTRRQLHA